MNELDEKALKANPGIVQSTVLPKIAPNVDPADLNAVQALQLCLERIASSSTPKEKKATYLLWVMHIVGDLHQPLHSTSL
ncbi:MAG TPA: S1/P1 nuclease [Gemmataceae bacterium]|nr:S1/P1 nuclease [Gemmataceae bacterium]